ncbi:hypothetical protein PROPEN_02514 [Proteus penneri ATCC 35198]|nr:hypothetical protein PROPEN_02514 [Proteus penneri ATCC 35198]
MLFSLLFLGFNRTIAFITLIFTALSAFITDVITWQALPIIFSILLLTFAYSRYKTQPLLRAIIIFALIIIASGLAFHLIPGFNNLRYLSHAIIGMKSAPFPFLFQCR